MTQHWLDQIAQITADFEGSFHSLTSEALNFKPDPNTWSIAQNIDHLMVTNSSYFPVLEQLHQSTYRPPFTGRIGFIPRFLGGVILKSVQPEQRKKNKTFPVWEPEQSELPATILHDFATHQKRLSEEMKAAEDLLEQGALITSPANQYIVYPLHMAFEIIVKHEQRHLLQAKEVLSSLQAQAQPEPIA